MGAITKRQLQKQRKKRRLEAQNRGTNPVKVWKNTASVRIDKDIDINQVQSKLIKYLLTKYESKYTKEENGVYYFLYDQFLMFSMQDCLPLPPNPNDKELIANNEELIFVPSVKAVYVCQNGRGQGRQEQLFNMLKAAGEEFEEGFYVFVNPFELTKPRKAINASMALITWFSSGDKKPENYTDLYNKQKNRLKTYGLENATYQFSELTPEDGQFLFIPKTLDVNIKKVYNSRKL